MRRAAKIAFQGGAYPQTFALADLRVGRQGDYRLCAAGGSFDEARALVVQGSKLVAAGNVGPFFDFGLARYKADGTLDRSFGSGGKVTTDFAGQTDEAFGLAVQADGRLVTAGFMLSEFGEMDFALARYRA